MQKERKYFSLKYTLLLLVVLPVLAVSFILTIFSAKKMRLSLQEEALDGLSASTAAMTELMDFIEGEWHQDENGIVYKGNTAISSNFDFTDKMKSQTGNEITIFWGDTRITTSITDPVTRKRFIGTQCTDEVKKAVLLKGEDYKSTSTLINGEEYYTYYKPLKDEDGSIIGMMFSGKPSAKVEKTISSVVMSIILIAFVIAASVSILALFITRKISVSIAVCSRKLALIAEGISQIDAAKNSIVDTIESLSAISEENAASAQETTASTTMLHDAMDTLDVQADELLQIAKTIDKTMQFFQTTR